MGAPDVPDFGTVTASLYVPAATCTVCPATALAAAAPMEQNGAACVPAPVLLHEALPLSTYRVVGVTASAVVAGRTAAPIAPSRRIPLRDRSHGQPPLSLQLVSSGTPEEWDAIVPADRPLPLDGPSSRPVPTRSGAFLHKCRE